MYVYEIRIQGHLDQHWATWFDGLSISYESDGSTLLRGPLVDEAALHGVLIKVRDLALPLLGMNGSLTAQRRGRPWSSIENKYEGEVPCYRGR